MKKVTGDLIKLGLDGKFDVIVHGCNIFCTMGKGIAKQIKATFPRAYKEDCNTIPGDIDKLGKVTFVDVDGLTIVNAYTQSDFRKTYTSDNDVRADYDAIRSAFKKIKEYFTGKRIGYPLIGCGLAGGDWNIVSKIIDEELNGEDHTLVEFDG